MCEAERLGREFVSVECGTISANAQASSRLRHHLPKITVWARNIPRCIADENSLYYDERQTANQRPRRRHICASLCVHTHFTIHQSTNTNPQRRRPPQDLPPHRTCPLGLRLLLLRSAANFHAQRPCDLAHSRDRRFKTHLHSPRPTPSATDRAIQPKPAAKHTHQVRTLCVATTARLAPRHR